MVVLFLLVVLASVYLVYVLEILKFAASCAPASRGRSEAEVDAEVRRSLETGEFEAVSRP